MKKKSLNQVTDFDLKLLRIFKTVADCGSFSAAESLLGITRSAISLHMGDLEQRLGMRLCQRGRAGFSLTDEGVEILLLSENMMSSVEFFRQQVNQMHEQLRGEFTIGIINNLVTQPMMRITHALQKLRADGPNIRINLSMCTPAEIERGLIDGHLHTGALPLISPLSGLNYRPLYEEKSSLYCGHTHPLFHYQGDPGPELLSSLDAVVPSCRMTAETIRLHQQLNGSATATDREGIAFLILTGKFVGYLPEHYANLWLEKNMMRALAPDTLSFSTTIAVATRKGHRPNAILDLFMRSLEH
ncbi:MULTISPECIES: LysR family transcriptional regulator [unclassified Tatumella]|uniref:LysR family transcriptional regulator n=1 Tax=unclassified Tatumella TaxID=2649542 RepID=UPI001BAF8381|nr:MULTISPECIES: LysR family transcriptional regulator [unclassified Tatumella]MBS0878956.1 LysR family transcriptional regulator [Tatumella sp. JGM82]MBS0891148.1 LysR family transcriptional regulator [Tatumella sp. JGM94]MBS0903184.1 LysR family transcriptional regulator [Tatumella sp. JGM100]